MIRFLRLITLLVAIAAVASPLAAQPMEMTDGEVRRIDKEQGKMSIRHGPLVNLDMPAMTMVFVVADRAMLDQVKVGDKVRFHADKIGGQYTVTKIEPAQ
jgi:Cu(I)/Ag(I) efflux system periplasmic protein CusF